jgi:metallophosphoesterase superfamily enzyme
MIDNKTAIEKTDTIAARHFTVFHSVRYEREGEDVDKRMLVEATVRIAGEELLLRADKTVFWPGESTLFVADVHLGKAASFRAFGVPAPGGTTDGTLGTLSQALDQTQARRLALLGDLWHARQGRTGDIIGKFLDWRRRHGEVEMILVEGNHDRRSGRLPSGRSRSGTIRRRPARDTS